jgi:hypothetical protein
MKREMMRTRRRKKKKRERRWRVKESSFFLLTSRSPSSVKNESDPTAPFCCWCVCPDEPWSWIEERKVNKHPASQMNN